MITIKFTYKVLGGHTHVVVRAGSGETLGLCGSLAFRNEEWEALKAVLYGDAGGVEPADIVMEQE